MKGLWRRKTVEEVRQYLENNQQILYSTSTSFREITSLRIGGKIAYFVEPTTIDALKSIYLFLLQKKIPYFIIGNGTNLLASDDVFDGVVVSLRKLQQHKIEKTTSSYKKIKVSGGASSAKVALMLAKNGFTGQEFLSVIPGSMAGCCYMNASSYGTSMIDILESVDFIREDGTFLTLSKEELKKESGYRKSYFQNHPGLILEVELKLQKRIDSAPSLKLIQYYKEQKHKDQPLSLPSAGSAFKNLEDKKAWKVIEELGFRGYQIGGAKVSEKHANFILNVGSATFRDMMTLMKNIQEVAWMREKVQLECEWCIFNHGIKKEK
jgi:UDP-N-acetylmuramate dehydrogenase